MIKISAQEKRPFFFAEIKDNFDFLPDVHIVNQQTKQGTFTNINGEFKIKAKENDSLSISIVGYKTTLLIVKKEHFSIKVNSIVLEKKFIDLDEVELRKTALTGFLSSDTKLVKHPQYIDAKTLELPNADVPKLTVAERRLYTATNGMSAPIVFTNFGFMVSTDYLINSISGRLKKLRKLKAFEDSEKHFKKLRQNYSDYITNELKIQKDHLNQFLYYLIEDDNFDLESQKREFTLIELIIEKANKFKVLKSKINNKNTTFIAD